MSDYVPPDTSVAEKVRLIEAETEAERRWFEHVASEQLQQILHDRARPAATRQNAFGVLAVRLRESPEFREGLARLLEPLLEDPDPEVAQTAVRYCPLSSEQARDKVRRLLDSPHQGLRGEAAVSLARIGDAGILERLLAWLGAEDEAEQNLAVEGLVMLNTPEARTALENAWHQGGRKRGDRVVLSVALLRLGDMRGLPLLETVAEEGRGAWSVTAATWLYYHQPARGLRMMLGILDQGDMEARQSMVMQISNLTRLPHVFTAEGLAEARSWVKRQMALDRRRRQ